MRASLLRLNDPRARFEKELKYFLNERAFKQVKKETEEYRYPPIVHIQNRLNPNILEPIKDDEDEQKISSMLSARKP